MCNILGDGNLPLLVLLPSFPAGLPKAIDSIRFCGSGLFAGAGVLFETLSLLLEGSERWPPGTPDFCVCMEKAEPISFFIPFCEAVPPRVPGREAGAKP